MKVETNPRGVGVLVPMSAPNIGEAERAAVAGVLLTSCLSLGRHVIEFERAIAAYLGARHGVAVASGTAALHLGVIAAGVGEGDLVLTSPFSFVASANVVLYQRALPVFVDIDPNSLNLDVEQVATALKDLTGECASRRRWLPPAEATGNAREKVGRPAALLPVHAFGQPALVHGSRALGEPRSTSWLSWRQQAPDLDKKSSVHPKYKTKYHVGNWPADDRALVQRGDITVWVAPAAIATWEAVGGGTRGGQRPSSDLAIETALTLRLIVPLPLRQTEGFLTSRAPYMCTRPPLVAPHTSPSLRLRTFPFPVAPTRANVDERRLPPRGGPESMTPHETVLTITPGDRPGRRKLDSYRVGTRETGDRDSRWSASGCMLSASPASFDHARPQHRPDERASTTRPRAPQTDRPRT